MAKKMKQALSVLLCVLLACSCFVVTSAAATYSGYTVFGASNALRVQTAVSADKSAYAVGDSVTATITLNHEDDSVIGYEGYVVFDSSKLEFQSVTLASGFDYSNASFAVTAASIVNLDVTTLTEGYGGTAFTSESFAAILGTQQMSTYSAFRLTLYNLNGLAAGSDTVATVVFSAKAATDKTNIGMVPSIVYSPTLGYLKNAATTSTNDLYETAFAAIQPSGNIAIGGDAPPEVFWPITFTGVYNQEAQTVQTKEGNLPTAPDGFETSEYDNGDYHFTFSTWSPALVAATQAVTYTAQYSSVFVEATNLNDLRTAYNNAVANRDDPTKNWTAASVAALNDVLDAASYYLVEGNGGRTQQANIQTMIETIANTPLVEQAATYVIKFVSENQATEYSSTTYEAGSAVTVPDTPSKASTAQFNYTFAGWKDKDTGTIYPESAIPVASKDTIYIAQFTASLRPYSIAFQNEDGSPIGSASTLNYGAAVTAPSVSKDQTNEYTYTLTGWKDIITLEVYAPNAIPTVTGSATYRAVFTPADRYYDIIFKTEDGEKIGTTQSLKWNAAVTVPEAPEKGMTAQYTYTFAGWEDVNTHEVYAADAVPAVAGPAIYAATYTQHDRTYEVKFLNDDGSQIGETQNIKYNAAATVPEVSKPADNEFTYTFAGWEDVNTHEVYAADAIPAVTDAVTYQAKFDADYIPYEISFTWHDGSSTISDAHWNTAVTLPTVPTYDADGKTYTCIGWKDLATDTVYTSANFPLVAGDAAYEAVYSGEDIYYTIIFDVEGVKTPQSVKANTMPDVPDLINHADPTDGDYEIEFTGWDVTPTVATADGTTYTAQYNRTFVPATDNGRLEAALLEASGIDKSIYTDETVAALETAVNNAVTGLGRTRNADVTAWAQALEDALTGLIEKPADYSGYYAALEALDAELAKTDDYTPASIASVKAQRDQIDADLDKDLTIVESATVQIAQEQIEALITQLKPKADKNALKSLIDQASALNADLYTDFSAVTAALATAQSTYDNQDASDDDVIDAKTALQAALNGLVFKDAVYDDWNTLVAQFDAIQTQYYTPASVAAVNNIISQVVENQNINYQATLDDLTAQLEAAIGNLELITDWAGETDYNGVDHEYFHSNLEFEQVIDDTDPTNIVINVYLNHPEDVVDSIQIAALYDAAAMNFVSANIVGGALTDGYAPNTGDAIFNPADYGLNAMTRPSVLMFAADFTAPLAKTDASRDLIATLHFTATGAQDSSYIKLAPIAASNAAGKSIYSALLDENYNEKFIHNDAITLVLAEVETGIVTGVIDGENDNAEVTVLLSDGTNQYTANVAGTGSYTIEGVLPGTYVITVSAPGSLGHTIYNVKVEAGAIPKDAGTVYLYYGDNTEDGKITLADLNNLISYISANQTVAVADVNGDNKITLYDFNMVINHYNMRSVDQTTTLP